MNKIDSFKKEYKGHEIRVSWYADEDMCEPWKEHDGHGVVSEWTTRDKAPGELVLVSDRHSRRFYDLAATTKIATKDGWGLCDKDKADLAAQLGHKPSNREVVAEAVRRDYEHLRGWCNGEWCWVGRIVKIYKSVSDTTLEAMSYDDGLWGIDGTGETIKEYTEEAFQDAIKWIDNELVESVDAASRDIVTVH